MPVKGEELELMKRAYKLFRTKGYKRNFKNWMVEVRDLDVEKWLNCLLWHSLFHEKNRIA